MKIEWSMLRQVTRSLVPLIKSCSNSQAFNRNSLKIDYKSEQTRYIQSNPFTLE